MRTPRLILAGALALAGASTFAQGQDLAGAMAAVRERGCAGHAGPRSALQWPPALAEAARRVARGEPALQAAREAGYRSRKVYQIRLSGYGSAQAVARTLAQEYCSSLADPAFTGVGVHREGSTYWIVLAALHQTPVADEAGEVAARVLALTNEARSQARNCGAQRFEPVPPLRANRVLERAALAHAQDMARHGYLAHEGRDGSTVGERLDRVGYRWRSAGENIASGQGDAQEVVRDWLRSPQHCSAIMNPNFTDMGVAFAVNARSESGIYWAQEFGRAR